MGIIEYGDTVSNAIADHALKKIDYFVGYSQQTGYLFAGTSHEFITEEVADIVTSELAKRGLDFTSNWKDNVLSVRISL